MDRAAVGDLVGRRPEEAGLPEAQAALWAHVNRRVLAGETVTYLSEIETSRGRIQSEATLAPLIVDGSIVGGIGIARDQSALVAAQREQAATQARLETPLALSSDWLWETDSAHRLTSVRGDGGRKSPAFADGGDRPVWEIVREVPDREATAPDLRQVLESREVLTGRICEVTRRDGTPASFEISGRPRYDDAGTFLGYWGVARDVSAREDLSRHLRFADRVITATRTAAVLADACGLVEWVNPAFEQLTGYTLADVRGRKPGEFLQCPQTDREVVGRISQAVRSGREIRETLLNRSKSGRVYWVDLEIRPLRSPSGDLTGYMAIQSDVTEVVESRQRLEAIVDNVAAGVVIHGASGDILASNPEACRLLHMTEAQMRGQAIMDPSWGVIFPDGRPMSGADMPSTVTLHTGQPVRNQIVGVRRPDGDIQWLRVNTRLTSPAPTADRQVVASFIDITAEEAHKQQLEETKALLHDIIETIPDAVVAFDRSDRLIVCNRAFRDHYRGTSRTFRATMTFEEMLIDGLEIGLYPDAGETEEERRIWLQRRLRAHRRSRALLIQKHSDGKWSQIRERVSRAGVTVCVWTDITSVKQAEEEIRRIAETDSLTGAPNRNVMIRELVNAAGAARRERVPALFGIVDLDQFKLINDTYGHDAGDRLLQETVVRLERFVANNGGGTVARLGGDEFAFLLSGDRGGPAVSADLDVLHASLCEPVRHATRKLTTSVSIGVARLPSDGDSATEVFKSADLALYQAKASGRNTWRHYDERYRCSQDRRNALAAALKQAIADMQIDIAYQPQVQTGTGAHVGIEALARWSHDGVPVPPTEFVAIAEEAGLGLALGWAVIERAFRDVSGVIARGGDPGRLSLNLSTSQVRDPRFPDRVADLLDAHPGLRGRLEFEITENVLLDQRFEDIDQNVRRLHEIGALISLDDFGTGYGSLSHLWRLPISKLKIDKSFVQSIDDSSSAATIVRTTTVLAHSLGMTVVAEGVETQQQRRFLLDAGCDGIQGYLVSRPTHLDQALAASRAARNTTGGSSDWEGWSI